MGLKFLNILKENGWEEFQEDQEYRKGDWFIFRDTGAWWMIGTANKARLYDVPEPNGTEQWTLNLIEYLCSIDDELNRLRAAAL